MSQLDMEATTEAVRMDERDFRAALSKAVTI